VSAMMTEPLASTLLAQELWISLAGLLRSHVEMRSIARPDFRLRFSGSGSAVEVLGPNGRLSLLAPTISGTGTMEFRPEAGELGDEYSAFVFTEDGLFYFENSDANGMEMEAAVEFLLDKVTR
jgi:hypothetical protein